MKRSEALVLAGDIGATKTDLGLFSCSRPSLPPTAVVTTTFASRGADGILKKTREFMAREKASGRVVTGCFGVAGPVSGGRVRAVNLGLELEENQLAADLGVPAITLVNDLYATAYALARYGDDGVEILQEGEPSRPAGVAGVLAPGTGLGMALIQKTSPPLIFASEGGHCDFAPRNPVELELWQWLGKCFGHVSRERLLSGPGLCNIYRWLKGLSPESGCRESAAMVVAAAQVGEDKALRALDIFTGIMGAVAGDLALLGLTAAGIYLAGGMPPRVLPFLRRELFLAAFRGKGRLSGWLEQVPVKLVLNPRTALFGAALIARDGI